MSTKNAVAAPAAASQQVAAIGGKPSLVMKFAAKYGVDSDKMLSTLKATAFKTGKNDPEVTNEQMVALLVVADQYQLNPFLKEIYAFPDGKGGIVPMVPVDGWIRIINERPEIDAIEFRDADTSDASEIPAWIECTISRKDRSKPIVVREYFAECKRGTQPWQSHPRRMLRHKALIQCARVAFGFAGIFDPDEGERIRDSNAIEGTATEVIAGKSRTQPPRARAAEAPAAAEPAPTHADLTAAMDRAGIPTSEVLEKFEVDGVAIESLPAERIPEALAWIRSLNVG